MVHVESMAILDPDNWGLLHHASAGDLYDRIRLLEEACQRGRDALRLLTADAGGRLPLDDGRELVIERQERREVLYGSAIPILHYLVRPEQDDDIFHVNKTAVEKAVKDNAPPGQKGAAVQDLYQRLDAAGAIRTTYQERLEVRRSVPQITQEKAE